ncbi:unannotated protein [freshwater metagenome]|uniref:Unannotated protein n=1 Tax=freshwater metagenome TaxID=449393 RepID=A0A6J7NFU4_9ZZZZ
MSAGEFTDHAIWVWEKQPDPLAEAPVFPHG